MITMKSPAPTLRPAFLCGILCIALLMVAPAGAFTADSLNITVATNGDATASFSFTLDGVIENAIPLSMLQDQLVKGLATSSDPPQVLSFDRSEAILLLKNFAVTKSVPTGTEYQTAPMDFKNAQIALQNSAVSTVISADFSPKIITVTFPDGYSTQLTDSSVLPGLKHTVIDPAKAKAAPTINASSLGAIWISSSPENVRVYIDGTYAGESPGTFSGIVPGEHQVMLEADGFVSLTQTVMVNTGETTMLSEALDYAAAPTNKANAPGAGAVIAVLALAGYGTTVRRRK
ncbi:MAG: PEGA domain-containing protein [Methanoregula sp.]|uniref:PEGA domain-containing protein n=1 Tax=Methanoregula sp. TaxID=2052170 RepID=UPI003C25F620